MLKINLKKTVLEKNVKKYKKTVKKTKDLSLTRSDKNFGPGFALRRSGKAGSIIR